MTASKDESPFMNYAEEHRLRMEDLAWRNRAKTADKAGDVAAAAEARRKAEGFRDSANLLVAERRRLQVAHGVAADGETLDSHMERACNVWSVNSELLRRRRDRKKKRTVGPPPRDPEFPGVDTSPIPPLPNPLPGIADGSEYAQFDANRFVKHVADTMIVLGPLVPTILGCTCDPELSEEDAERAAPFLESIIGKVLELLDSFATLLNPCVQTQFEGRTVAPFFDGPMPDPLPKIPDEAGSAIAIAVFPRVYPFIRIMCFAFVSSRRRQIWNVIDPAVDLWEEYLPNVDAQKFKGTRSFNSLHDQLRSPLWAIVDILARYMPVSQRIADDPLFLGAVLDGICLDNDVIEFAYGYPEMSESRLVKAITSVINALKQITIIASDNKVAWRDYSARRGRYGDSAQVIAPRLLAMAPWTLQKKLTNAINILTPFYAACGPLFSWQAESLEEADRYFTIFRKVLRERRQSFPDRCDGCGVFSSKKLQRCARCRIARYCSAECQKRAWLNEHGGHKNGCTKVVMPDGMIGITE